MATEGKVIRCKAAVAWEAKQPLVIEDVEVAPPKQGEVRIKIVATGVCHSDATGLKGIGQGILTGIFPTILGHEGSGIVESVGPGVTNVKPGDHVIPLYMAECGECDNCKSPKTNLCTKIIAMQMKGFMPDGTSRFTCKGKVVHHYMGTSTFSQYTVVSDVAVVKIPDSLPLEKVCLLGCGVSTGYGAVINTAQVEEGSTCAIWGLGGIGLAVAMGCKARKAARIIGVDVNENKFEMAKVFGVTEFVNPKNLTKPVHEAIADLTNGGCDYTFECIGNVATMRDAFDSCRQGWGQCIIIGVPPAGEEMSVQPADLLYGKVLKGTGFGGWKSRSSMPRLVRDYQEKRIILDEFVTFTRPLDRINEGFELMNDGKAIRTVINMF